MSTPFNAVRLKVKCWCLLGFADLWATYLRCGFVHFQVGLEAFHDEAVHHIAPVNILSRDRSWVVVAQWDGALGCPCARARDVEHVKAALLIEQEAVIHEVSIDVISRDRPRGVVTFREGTLPCACARARSIERGEGTLVRPQEPMKHTVCVDINSFDLPAPK